MLMYGTSTALSVVDLGKTVVFSINSMVEGLPTLQLVPPRELGYLSDYDFDVAYYNWVLGNDYIFHQFFTIINNLYIGSADILLLFSNDPWSENLAESLLKIIQQRYGYNGVLINNIEDYIQANHMEFNFNREYGLYNLDQDKQRYAIMSESIRLANGGKPCMEDDDYYD